MQTYEYSRFSSSHLHGRGVGIKKEREMEDGGGGKEKWRIQVRIQGEEEKCGDFLSSEMRAFSQFPHQSPP